MKIIMPYLSCLLLLPNNPGLQRWCCWSSRHASQVWKHKFLISTLLIWKGRIWDHGNWKGKRGFGDKIDGIMDGLAGGAEEVYTLQQLWDWEMRRSKISKYWRASKVMAECCFSGGIFFATKGHPMKLYKERLNKDVLKFNLAYSYWPIEQTIRKDYLFIIALTPEFWR